MKSSEQREKAWEWLKQKPTLAELRSKYPEEWTTAERDLTAISHQGLGKIQATIEQCARQEELLGAAFSRGQKIGTSMEKTLAHLVRSRMIQLALRQHCVAVASGVKEGKVRFNLVNGLLAQQLLFRQGLERKPVALFWFRLLWPLLWQKRRLMPLVQPQGIYCFYSRPLIKQLAELIGPRTCLEIAAGDGTLSRFLKELGVQITATDDQSWGHAMRYPESVIKREAREALSIHAPEVVVCSWPPPGNNFERQVFKTRSVELYIVIGSRHRHAAGNWDDYEQQSAFSGAEDHTLSELVLPPELDSAVYVFRRNPPAKPRPSEGTAR
ncbi:MAG: SAM-dependent methyltransferase [Desulfobulbaceae bacterium]|nr:SAM-dependent methyltransferase [Desulfobulbaceae bacterium]